MYNKLFKKNNFSGLETYTTMKLNFTPKLIDKSDITKQQTANSQSYG